MDRETLSVIIIAIPFAVVFLIFAILNYTTKSSRIEELREKVKSLPLDEETIKERLKMFDRINSSVGKYEAKIRLLTRVASGEKIELKKLKKKRTIFKPYDFSEKSMGDRTIDDMSFGIIPSRSFTHRGIAQEARNYSSRIE